MKDRAAQGPAVIIVLAGSLGAFTLWDYYFGPFGGGVRVFDLLSVGLITLSLFTLLLYKGPLVTKSIRLPSVLWVLLFAQIALFILSGVIGSFRDQANFLRPTVGIWMGMSVFLVYYCVNVSGPWVDGVVRWLIIVHAVSLVVQFVTYYSTGVLINYQEITGAEPRVYSSIFRPSGLFLEPSSYSTTVIMLLLLRWRDRPMLDGVSWVALGSVVLTVSLFGLVAVLSIFVFFFWRQVWFWLGGCTLVLVTIFWFPDFRGLPASAKVQVANVVDRVQNLRSDVSISSRYKGLLENLSGTRAIPSRWFGRGLGNDYVEHSGASGIGFLLAAVGMVGALLWLAMAMGLSPRGRRIKVLFSVLLVLLAAQIWTMMFWWAWLGLLFNPSVAGPNLSRKSCNSIGGGQNPLLLFNNNFAQKSIP